MSIPFELYSPGRGGKKLPPHQSHFQLTDPAQYLPSQQLSAAVNVALTLGKPLFLTGEPGSGKTQLAYHLAHHFQLPPPLVYVAKTNSNSRELFYQYDHLRHFHDANYGRLENSTSRSDTYYENYIYYNALGKAIIRAIEEKERSVVLIDEIDKAPRDFPNDILSEIENMRFTVMETGKTYEAPPELKPVVIITSNSERSMPDAFLRRCVYFHIHFPSLDQLRHIVLNRIRPIAESYNEEKLRWLLEHFQQIREISIIKRPATAELLSWVELLEAMDFKPKTYDLRSMDSRDRDILLASYAVLVKHVEDLQALQEKFYYND